MYDLQDLIAFERPVEQTPFVPVGSHMGFGYDDYDDFSYGFGDYDDFGYGFGYYNDYGVSSDDIKLHIPNSSSVSLSDIGRQQGIRSIKRVGDLGRWFMGSGFGQPEHRHRPPYRPPRRVQRDIERRRRKRERRRRLKEKYLAKLRKKRREKERKMIAAARKRKKKGRTNAFGSWWDNTQYTYSPLCASGQCASTYSTSMYPYYSAPNDNWAPYYPVKGYA